MWRPDIVEALFKANPHARFAFNADEFVVGGAVVHIPQSGGGTTVERNRATLPAPIVKRADTDIIYALEEYTTDPRLITDIDKKELSYDKRMSVISEETGAMMEFVGDDLAYKWAVNVPAANKILSTGAAAAGTAPGASGNRKILTEADIRKARALLSQQSVPMSDRYMMLSPNVLDHLMSDNNLKYAFQQVVDLPEGVIGRLYGFNILERPSVVVQGTGGTSGTVKLPEAASATDDDDCVLFWHANTVERAMGTVTIFDNPNRAEYYGDIVSFLVRMGGRARREDNKGVGLIVLAP
jgi:hypothetical protein